LGHSPKGQNSTLQPTMGWGKLLSPKLGSFTLPLTPAQHLALLINGGDEAEPFVQIDS